MTRTSEVLKFRIRVLALTALALAGVSSTATAQLPLPMPPAKTLEVFGQTIRYYEAGQGPALIFLHGLGGEASNWAPNIGAVSAHYHVYALDQIGFGDSAKPLIDYKIQTFVDFLHEFISVLAIPRATLVGNSLGGWIAVDFAAAYPAMTDKLVLVDAAGLSPQGPPGPRVDLNPASLEGMRRIMEFVVYNKQLISDALVRRAFEDTLRQGDGYTIQRVIANAFLGNQYEDAQAATLHAPTLIIWGRQDQLIPLAAGERYQKLIPGAKLVVFDECGHIPQLEKALDFNKALMDFLAGPQGATPNK